MNQSILSNILTIGILLILSAFFSATETAFSSLNRTRLKTMSERGERRAQAALDLADNYDKLLSTILVGNNIVNIAMASIGTMLFVKIYGDLGATISTIVVTVIVLIFGEISPKSLAKESPERFAMFSAPIMKGLIWILTPVNFLFAQWKKLMSKIVRVSDDRKMTQDELLMLVCEAEQEGGIDQEESELLRSCIEFNDLDAEDILTHRVDLEAVPVTASREEVARLFSETRYSRLLVYQDTIDNIVGVIHQKDFYTAKGITEKDVTELMTKPIFVPKSVLISDLLKLLQKNKVHIAVVSDEYGGTLGIVTMEDILEELVGDIWDEHDEVIEYFHKMDPLTYKVDGSTELEKMCEFFDVEADSDSTSVSGWVMERLNRIPEEGDSFDYQDLHITVSSADVRRVLEIEVQRRNITE